MEPTISCDHHQPRPGKDTAATAGCALGLFGGHPYHRNCLACIAAGENNPAYATRLFTARETTHPPHRPRISGCCDPVP